MRENQATLDRLWAHLRTLPEGKINNTAVLESLLADAWDELTGGGNLGGMEGSKLLGRMEDATWRPPVLSFVIERHGGTVCGSSRAELQGWTIDSEQGTASWETKSHRQLYPMGPRLKLEPLAEEVVRLIVGRQEDDRLQWHKDGSVKVLIGKVIPQDSAYKQTLAGRRKRFHKALVGRLAAEGWNVVSPPYRFAPVARTA
jgi:hypothetical protein